MPRILMKTVRLEGGELLSPKNKRWERRFKELPKDTQKRLVSSGAVREIADEDDDEDDEVVPVADLADHLAGITSADEVKALQKADKRTTAAKHYEARLKELSAPPAE